MSFGRQTTPVLLERTSGLSERFSHLRSMDVRRRKPPSGRPGQQKILTTSTHLFIFKFVYQYVRMYFFDQKHIVHPALLDNFMSRIVGFSQYGGLDVLGFT